MTEFDETLLAVFGPRESEFSDDLRERLFELWINGFVLGADIPHICGGFNPTTQGPVGPEGCDACQMLSGTS